MAMEVSNGCRWASSSPPQSMWERSKSASKLLRSIDIDWDVIEKLQECRNHLEHLHPAHTLGEVADFVAELFPVLRDFIQTELGESPAAILGDAWQLMLLHHNFFVDTTQRCEETWSEACVPEGMELNFVRVFIMRSDSHCPDYRSPPPAPPPPRGNRLYPPPKGSGQAQSRE